MDKKEAIIIHSGGMDSSICLALAAKEFGHDAVLGLSFSYGQRHSVELSHAKKICSDWNIDHVTLSLACLEEITDNALMNTSVAIKKENGGAPNTLVIGRNGLMARIGAIYAHHLRARCIFMGVVGIDACNAGYRDCSRNYMDLMENILRIDLEDSCFQIRTPLVDLTKAQTLALAYELGILEYLLNETITCYEGIPRQGCMNCVACQLRNEGIRTFSRGHPEVILPYDLNLKISRTGR